MLSRRVFLSTAGLTACSAMAGGLIHVSLQRVPGSNVRRSANDCQALIEFALAEASRLGCDYADVAITWRGALAGPLTFRVRVDHPNGWGGAECSTLSRSEIARTTAQAVANARVRAASHPRGWSRSDSPMTFPIGETYFASSQGAVIQSLEPAAGKRSVNQT